MSHLYDVIIIGGGPAGYSAALYSARAGLETLVIEKFSVGGQMTLTDVIDNYPGFEEGIDGISLGFKMQQGAERYGAKTEYDEILEVSLDGKTKSVKGAANEYKAKAVIIQQVLIRVNSALTENRSLSGKVFIIVLTVTEGFIKISLLLSSEAVIRQLRMEFSFKGSRKRFILFTEEMNSGQQRSITVSLRGLKMLNLYGTAV